MIAGPGGCSPRSRLDFIMAPFGIPSRDGSAGFCGMCGADMLKHRGYDYGDAVGLILVVLNAGNGWDWGNGMIIDSYCGILWIIPENSLRLAPVSYWMAMTMGF